MEIQRRWAELASGPWKKEKLSAGPLKHVVRDERGQIVCACRDSATAIAVANARADIRWLIDEVRELRNELVEAETRARGETVFGKSGERDITLATITIEKGDADPDPSS